MIELVKKIKKVSNGIVDGVETFKSYTNFAIRIPVGDNYVDVPIQPVNFGEKTNRKGYSLLSAAAKDVDELAF